MRKYHFNTWYLDNPSSYPIYMFVTNIKSSKDSEGYWGWRFEYRDTEFKMKEWNEDNSSPSTWVDLKEPCLEREPPLDDKQKIAIFKDLFSI